MTGTAMGGVARAVGSDAGNAAADERLRRWRMVLGGGEADGTGCALGGRDAAMDAALGALYGGGPEKERGSGPPGSGAARRGWRAGWETSVRTSPARSSRSCSGTPSSGSACPRC